MRADAVMYDGSDTHPTLTVNNAGGGQRMPDKENFNGIVEMTEIQDVCGPMETKDGRGVHSQMAGEGKLIPVEIQNFKSNLAGGDTETAMVTGDHDSRSTDFTNLVTSKTAVEAFASPQDHDIDRGHMTECAPTIGAAAGTSGNNRTTIAYDVAGKDAVGIGHGNQGSMTAPLGDVMPTLTNDDFKGPMPAVANHYAVRRITPIEGERLQGFSDGWTRPCFAPDQITDELVDRFVGIHQNWSVINGKPGAKPPSRKKVRAWLEKIIGPDCPDGPRYKAIGNSMSVNVMTWIGLRIREADNKYNENKQQKENA